MHILRRLAVLVAALAISGIPLAAQAQFSLAVTIGTPPPPIPVYDQPFPPGPNYIWEPGYWAWGPYGYYWVPGTWVLAPQLGLYWTPGYWNWSGDGYAWMPGYWANQVGYYGGVNYGFGYFSAGYVGGYWSRNVFVYNTYVTRVDPAVVQGHVYRRYYAHNWNNRVDYDGGRGGLSARPTAAQVAVSQARHWAPTASQVQHARVASQNRYYLANVNHGRPSDPAVTRTLSSSYRPTHFAAVTAHDRTTPAYHAPVHAAAPAQAPVHHAAAPAYHAPVHAAAPAQAPVHHAAAPAYHAPVHAAAPVHQAPMHAAPAYHAPVAHQMQQHAPAPAQHAAPQKAAPADHSKDQKDQH